MTCEEAHSYIKPFLKHSLSARDTMKFIRHMDQCRDCSDDMEVAYMIDVMSGVSRGEDLPTYDLKRLFRDKIASEKKKCRRRFFFLIAGVAAGVSVLALFLFYPF